jgi:hypothetical protein
MSDVPFAQKTQVTVEAEWLSVSCSRHLQLTKISLLGWGAALFCHFA